LSSGVILFDGTCAFCEGSVRFVSARDRGYFRFGASQNPAGQELLTAFGRQNDAAGSLILIEDGQIYMRSEAVLRIARRMTAPWNWAQAFLIVPVGIRDAVYRFVAANRHRIAGTSNACEIPPPEIRSRLI
jgi:predicted DCC family thiol-disulfide oxidoreductase YuxK